MYPPTRNLNWVMPAEGVMVAIIVVGGVAPSSAPPLPSNPVLTVAADGGLDVAVALAIEVDLVVGDLDSVDPAGLAEARERGMEVRRFAAAKNHTDLELAIDAALEVEPSELVIVGGGGGRLDHLIGVLAALAGAAGRGANVTGYVGTDLIWLVGAEVCLDITAPPGTTLSLMPLGGPATVRRAIGLRWPLSGVMLSPWEALGVSNLTESPEVSIEVSDGVVAVIAPGPETPARTHRPPLVTGLVGTSPPVGCFRTTRPPSSPQPGEPR